MVFFLFQSSREQYVQEKNVVKLFALQCKCRDNAQADARENELLTGSSNIELHYRMRFDPAGTSESDRVALKKAVRAWVAAQSKA